MTAPRGDPTLAFMAAVLVALVGMALGAGVADVAAGRSDPVASAGLVFVFGAPVAAGTGIVAYGAYRLARTRGRVSRRSAVACGVAIGGVVALGTSAGPGWSTWIVAVGALAGAGLVEHPRRLRVCSGDSCHAPAWPRRRLTARRPWS